LHLILTAAHRGSSSSQEFSLEVIMKRLPEPFSDPAVGTKYAYKGNASTPNRVENHFSQHAPTQTALIVQCAIDIKYHQPNRVPIQPWRDRARIHCSLMKR
jgi:hypothetical protein